MTRRNSRQGEARARIAALAARIMAQDGIDDFGLAKRKAARQLGADETRGLPGNDEVQAELDAYRALYQAEVHAERIAELRRIALDAMLALERFTPYLTGPVLKGTAGPYAEIELLLFPESAKEVEVYLIEHGHAFKTREATRFSGERSLPVSVLSLTWEDAPLKLSVFDPREERVTVKTSIAGRVQERAGVEEVRKIAQLRRNRI